MLSAREEEVRISVPMAIVIYSHTHTRALVISVTFVGRGELREAGGDRRGEKGRGEGERTSLSILTFALIPSNC